MVAAAANPGAVNSDIWRSLPRALACAARPLFAALFLTPAQGAATSVHGVTSPAVVGGEYLTPYWLPATGCGARLADTLGPFAGPRPARSSAASYDVDAQDAVWAATEALLARVLGLLPPVRALSAVHG